MRLEIYGYVIQNFVDIFRMTLYVRICGACNIHNERVVVCNGN